MAIILIFSRSEEHSLLWRRKVRVSLRHLDSSPHYIILVKHLFELFFCTLGHGRVCQSQQGSMTNPDKPKLQGYFDAREEQSSPRNHSLRTSMSGFCVFNEHKGDPNSIGKSTLLCFPTWWYIDNLCYGAAGLRDLPSLLLGFFHWHTRIIWLWSVTKQ